MAAADAVNRVLVLQSYHGGLSWTDGVDQGIRDVLGDRKDVEIYAEYLDAKRQPVETLREPLVELLRLKYREDPPDVVIASDNAALEFVQDVRDAVFPNTPVVFCGINNFCPEMLRKPAGITGVVERTDAQTTVDLIRLLRPGLRRCVVIGDTTTTGQAEMRAARASLGNARKGVQIEYWEGFGLSDILERLQTLDADHDAVLLTVYNRDPSGRYYAYEDSARRMVAASPVPVFGLWDFYVGTGVVGGHMASSTDQGRSAGELAARLLDGARVDEVPIVRQSPNRTVLDATAAGRFGLDLSRAPAGAIVRNRPGSILREYWREVVAASALMTGEALLILFLGWRWSIGRRRAMARIRASETRLSQIAEQSRTFIWEVDARGQFTYVSHVVELALGYSPAEFVGCKRFYDLVPECDQENIRRHVLRTFRQRAEFVNVEATVIRKDGEKVWMSVNGIPVFNARGKPVGYRGSATDITSRKRAEEEIKRQAGLITSLLDSIPDLIFYKDVNGRYIGCNPSFAEFVGRPREEIIGRSDYELFPREVAARFRENDEQMLLQREPRHNEEWVKYPDGRAVLLDTVKTPYWDPFGSVMGILGISRDITEQRRAEEQRRESEAMFRMAIDRSPIGVAMVDRDANIIECNHAMAEIVGYTREEFLELNVSDFTHPDDAEREWDLARKVWEGHIPDYRMEKRYLHRDGHVVWVDIYNATLCDDAGNVKRGFAFVQDITERKESETKVRRAMERLQLAADAAAFGVWDLDLKHNALEWDDWMYRLYGVTPDQFDGAYEAWARVVHPDDLAQASQEVQEAIETGKNFDSEFRIVRPDGAVRYIRGYAIVTRDADGTPVRMTGINYDTTDQKETEQQIVESRQFLEDLFESVQDGISVINSDLTIRMTNGVMRAWYGQHASLEGQKCYACYHGKDAPCDPCPTQRAFRSGQPETDIVPVLNGPEPVWYEIFAYPMHDRTTGRIHSVIEFVRDITERKRVDASLRTMLEEQEAVFESSLVGIVLLQQRVITKVNRRMAEMLGYTREELVGESPRKLHVSDAHFDQFGEKYYGCLAEQDLIQVEYPLRHKDGHTVWCQFNGRAVAPPDLSTGVVWVIDDITERKHAEEQLKELNARLADQTERSNSLAAAAERASAAKSEFLANMSHEIRTPMTAILGFAEAARDGCPARCEFGKFEHREHLDTITRNGKYLLQLLSDILDLSKIEAGKLSIERVEYDVQAIFDDVESLVRVRSNAKALDLRFEFDGEIPAKIQTDPTRLRQILINLLGNAIKFTETGHVSLIARMGKATAAGPTLEFDVVDTGIGMTPEQSSALFQPFSQADASTTRKFGGTGLGLAISKRLAEILGGDVKLVESMPGSGSRFRVTIETGPLDGVQMLSRHSPENRVNPEPAASPSESPPLSCRILLAEDGPDNQRLIAHLLRKAGAEVTIVENGALAVDAAIAAHGEGHAFDVILMDMQMPVMDGYTATTSLRDRGYTGLVIALTANAMATDRQKCLDAGCNDYISKPIDRARLIETIHQLRNGVARQIDA